MFRVLTDALEEGGESWACRRRLREWIEGQLLEPLLVFGANAGTQGGNRGPQLRSEVTRLGLDVCDSSRSKSGFEKIEPAKKLTAERTGLFIRKSSDQGA